jgi:hypothetical protein
MGEVVKHYNGFWAHYGAEFARLLCPNPTKKPHFLIESLRYCHGKDVISGRDGGEVHLLKFTP